MLETAAEEIRTSSNGQEGMEAGKVEETGESELDQLDYLHGLNRSWLKETMIQYAREGKLRSSVLAGAGDKHGSPISSGGWRSPP